MKTGLSIIIPCRNEEKSIGYCVKAALSALTDYKIPGEVIVIDNNSTDYSAEIAQSAGARVVKESNIGYGNAYITGIKVAKFRFCLKVDADGSYDLKEISKFWDILIDNKGDIEPGAMPFLHKYIGTPIITTLINFIYKGNLTDINSGMRGFVKRKILNLNLKCKGMEFASEMCIKALKKRYSIVEVPITLHKDLRESKSHLKTFRDGWRHLSIILLMSPFHLFFYPGVVFIGLGILFSLILLFKEYLIGSHQLYWDPFLDIITFSCIQCVIIIGEFLMLFFYITKLRLIDANIDVSNKFFDYCNKIHNLGRLIKISIFGIVLSSILTIFFFHNLYQKYFEGVFSTLHIKLALFNFTIFLSFLMMMFTYFFISGIKEY